MPRVLVALRRDDVDAEHDVGTIERFRRPEPLPVDGERIHHERRCEMRGKCVRQSELGRHMCAEEARTKNPDWNAEPRARNRLYALTVGRGEVAHQLEEILRKGIGVAPTATKRP